MTSTTLGRPSFRTFVVGSVVLWAVPVVAALRLDAPFGVKDAGALTSALLAPASARYLGYCPMPLVVYLLVAMLVRHPLALVLGAQARAAVGSPRDRTAALRAAWRAGLLWIGLAFGGALLVRLLIHGGDAISTAWAIEIGKITVLAGLPCVAAAITLGLLVRKPAVFYTLALLCLVVLALFAFGLRGGRIAPVLPGTIETALTSGREALRAHAFVAALAWPVAGWLLATVPNAGRLRVLLIAVLALMAPACAASHRAMSVAGGAGSSDGAATGSNAAAAGTSADRCLTSCETLAQCGGFPLSGCARSISCAGWPSNAWRDEVASAYLKCEKGCPKDPQTCVNVAFDTAGARRPIDAAYASACADKRGSCMSSESLKNDVCGEESLYVESAVTRAMTCLGEPCLAVSGCVDSAFQRSKSGSDAGAAAPH